MNKPAKQRGINVCVCVCVCVCGGDTERVAMSREPGTRSKPVSGGGSSAEAGTSLEQGLNQNESHRQPV